MCNRLRVLLVSPVGIHGGAEEVFLKLAKYLPVWDVEPLLVCLRPGPLVALARQQGLATYVFNKDYRYRNIITVLQGVRWLAHLVHELKVDLVHSNFTAHLISGPAARLAKVPELWHHHDYPYQPDFLSHLVERIPSNHIIFTTRRVESGYPHLHHRPHSVVHPVCVEPQRLRSYPTQEGIRDQFGLPAGPLFLTVTRLQKHKGHRFLIEAIPGVLQCYPETIFAIVGKASGREQEVYRQELLDQCSRRGVMERVRFLGYVKEEDLVALYREATALVHPATSEGFGLTLLEAMSLGTPVIAAGADGPREIITRDKSGLLVPVGDSAALTQAIVRLISNPTLGETLRQGGLHLVAQSRVENMVQQTVDIYRSLVAQR